MNKPLSVSLGTSNIAVCMGQLWRQTGFCQQTHHNNSNNHEAFHFGHPGAESFVASPNFHPSSVLTTATFHCKYRGRCDEMTTDFPVAESITSTFPTSVHICTSTVRTPSTSTGSDAPVM